ncbi:MAG: alpha/beta hydrolase [Trueperella sp.]|nr:alpha/beta hydrolase [Trueperella sp.]
MPADNSCITLPGPWQHKFITANGAQFHVALAGEYDADKPLVLLVHGFPQFWWTWRNQIPALAEAGYQVAAMDLRGYGGSDKPPNSENGLLSAQDLVAMVRALGYSRAVLVGLGRGGAHAWTAVSMNPTLFAGLVTVSAPHPRTLQRVGMHVTLKTWRNALLMSTPMLARRALHNKAEVLRMLRSWSAPNNSGATAEVDVYAQALQLPGVAQAAISQLRWTWLAQSRPSGRAYLRESAHSITIPVLTVRGELDPLLPARAWKKDGEFAIGPYQHVEISGVGHFAPEEDPARFNALLLDFLANLDHPDLRANI